MILSFYGLILAIKTHNNNYFIYLPIFLCLSFLSKQTPAAYGMITIAIFILTISTFYKKKRAEILVKSTIGTVIALVFLVLFFLTTKININEFFQQYIMYASSIGELRLNNYDFNLFNEIIKYKFVSVFAIFLVTILIKSKIKKSLNLDDFFIVLICISFSAILVLHQLISLNQNFIFLVVLS